MKSLLLFTLLALAIACKKDGKEANFFADSKSSRGIWVEKSLRLDTLDFDSGPKLEAIYANSSSVVFKSKAYIDTAVNPDYLINHSAIYSYYFADTSVNTIYMRSMLSSSSFYTKYSFVVSADRKSFTIQRFYGRNTLPGLIEFERVQ